MLNFQLKNNVQHNDVGILAKTLKNLRQRV